MKHLNGTPEGEYVIASSAVCTGYGAFDTHKDKAAPYDTVSAEAILAMVQDPPTVAKEQGQWIIPSAYGAPDARSHDAQRQRGSYLWLAADIDQGSPSLSDLAAIVRGRLGAVCFVIYSSRSATAANRKWRVLVPLAQPIAGANFSAYQEAFFDALEAQGLTLDRSLKRAGQLVYLPNRGAFYEHHIEQGDGIVPLDAQQHPGLSNRAAQYIEVHEAAATHVSGNARKEGSRSHIAAFRHKHSIAEMLKRCGYERKGSTDDWRNPSSTSGSYSLRDYGDYWISLGHTDAEAGIGKATANGSRYGDAYDLMVNHWGAKAAEHYARQCLQEYDDQRCGDATAEHGRAVWGSLIRVGGRRILDRSDNHIVLESPLEAIKLPGLSGRLADTVYEAGDRDTRIYGIAAGLLAVSALVAPLYVLQTHDDERVSLHMYGLVLGPTASGKEAIRSAIRMALEAAGRGDEFLDGIASMPALHDHLADPTGKQVPGAVALAMDEQGINLKIINSAAMGHQQLLMRGLMSLFGLGFGTLSSHKVRDKSKVIPPVPMPRTTALWTSTSGKFIDAINAEDSESGQLNRFLTFWVERMPPKRTGRARRSLMQGHLPDDVQQQCSAFSYETQEQYHAGRAPDRIVKTTPEALALMDQFETYVENNHIQGVSARHAESWGRAVEYLKKLSGILAMSDNVAAPICEAKHVELARQIVSATVGGIADLAEKSSAKKHRPDSWEKVEAFIKSKRDAEGWVDTREVKRLALQGVQDRSMVINEMLEAGVLEQGSIKSATRPKSVLRIAPD